MLIIISVLVLSVFNTWTMLAGGHDVHGACPISVAGVDCPEIGLAMYTGHLSLLKYFSQNSVNINYLELNKLLWIS